LLVIGNDTVYTPPPGWTTPAPNATDTPIPNASGWTATIHDRLVLNGQSTLIAPTMPPQPYYTPPATEIGGSYRIATLDPLTEVPCYLAWNFDRAAHSLNATVADEWLTENSRAITQGEQNNAAVAGTGGTAQFITGGSGHDSNSGGDNCASSTLGGENGNFSGQAQGQNPQSLWFGGVYLLTYGFGAAQTPIDPRFSDTVDPNPPMWP
jgi:hypothetical protein